MSTATDKAIPTWGEVKNSLVKEQYHWVWYYAINNVSTTESEYTKDNNTVLSLNGNTNDEHSSNAITLFQISFGELFWYKDDVVTPPYNIRPIYSCIINPCKATAHGTLYIPTTKINYDSSFTLTLRNAQLNLGDFGFKDLSFGITSTKNYEFSSAMIMWEIIQIPLV